MKIGPFTIGGKKSKVSSGTTDKKHKDSEGVNLEHDLYVEQDAWEPPSEDGSNPNTPRGSAMLKISGDHSVSEDEDSAA